MYMIDPTKVPSKKQGSVVLHMLKNMTGSAVFTSDLVESPKNPTDMKSSAQWESGYQHINLNGPASNAENKAYLWCDQERCEKSSPLFGWSRSIILGALQSKNTQCMLAQVVREYPLSLCDVQEWVLERVLKPALEHAAFSSI
eukprot:4166453-Amphidinium_carterae.1